MVGPLLALLVAPQAIELKIQTAKKSYVVGDNIGFSVVVSNRSKQDVLFTPVLDGSILGRSPAYKLWVQKAGSGWEQLTWTIGFCGNSNPLRAEDFITIPAKQSVEFKSGWWAPFEYSQLGQPGTYNVKLTCDTTQPLDAWIGGPLPPDAHSQLKKELTPLHAKVPKATFETKAITVQVLANK